MWMWVFDMMGVLVLWFDGFVWIVDVFDGCV